MGALAGLPTIPKPFRAVAMAGKARFSAYAVPRTARTSASTLAMGVSG
jgi:hypothetical protein